MNTKSRACFALVFTLTLFVFCVRIASADFEITEVMYDLDGTDTNREWIEVLNSDSSASDLSKWYVFSDNTKHALVPQGASAVPPGGYAVIAQDVSKFKADWPNYTGLLFDSSWTGFNNEGATIGLKDPDLNLVSSVTFTSSMGASGDGNSLQDISGTFAPRTPTPGATNDSTSSQVSNATTDTSTSSDITVSNDGKASTVSTTETTGKKKESEPQKINTDIIAKNTVLSGVSFPIAAKTINYDKSILNYGTFVWNLGDGTIQVDNGYQPFDHIYEYPGHYLVTLSYYLIYHPGASPDATDRVIITVITPSLAISSVGPVSDPYVELENKSSDEIDISTWSLAGATHTFYFPEGTILLPNQKIKFSPHASMFTAADIASVGLRNPRGEVLDTFPVTSSSISLSEKAPRKVATSIPKIPEVKSEAVQIPAIVDLNNLSASAKNIPQSNSGSSSSVAYSLAGLVGIIAIGSGLTVFARRNLFNRRSDQLEQELGAEDIKIIE